MHVTGASCGHQVNVCSPSCYHFYHDDNWTKCTWHVGPSNGIPVNSRNPKISQQSKILRGRRGQRGRRGLSSCLSLCLCKMIMVTKAPADVHSETFPSSCPEFRFITYFRLIQDLARMVKMRMRWVMLMMPNPVQRLLHHRSKPPLKLASPNPLLPVTPALVVILHMMKSYNHLDDEEKLKGNSDTHPIWSLVAMNMPEEGLPEIIMVLLFLFMKHRSVMIFAGAFILEICSFF